MTSLGVNQQHFPKGGPSIFKIQGSINHRIGSLFPCNQNDFPKFAQIYIYDTEHEIENRLKAFGDLDTGYGRNILEILQNSIKQNNPHVKNFISAYERFTNEKLPDINIILRADAKPHDQHSRKYNKPIESEIAVIIPRSGDGTENVGKRDIILHERDDKL